MADIVSNITDKTSEDVDPTQEVTVPGWGSIHVVLMGIILSLGLLGNTSICWIIFTDQKLRSGPNKLVLNLAVCGLFTVIANGPLVLLIFAEETATDWQYGYAACQFNGFTTSVYGLSSVLTLAVISVNRYQMIRRSTGRFASWFTRSTIRTLIAGVWILSAVLAFPPVVGWSQYEYIPERAICTLKWSTELYYTVFVFTLGIFLPFVVMFVAYFAIFRLVRHKFKKMRRHNARGNPNAELSRNVSNSSFGRFLANATERWESQQNAGRGAAADTVSVASASGLASPGTIVSKKPLVARNPFKAIVVSEADQENRAELTDQHKTELPQHLEVRQQRIGRAWSVGEAEIKGENKNRRVQNHMPSGSDYDKSLTLEVPTPRPPDPLQPIEASASALARPRSALARIQQTSTTPGQADKNANLVGRGSKSTGSKSSAGGAFLPPRDDLRVTVMVFTVLASFVLCWSPVTIINFVESTWNVDIPPALNVFSVYMIFASSAINPLIYGVLNRNFRSGFKRFFCSFWNHCGGSKWCSCLSAKKLQRNNRVSVIDLKEDTPPQ